MNTKPVIFVITSLLLVPLLYAASSVQDACAAARDPKWGGDRCSFSTDKEYKTCCWNDAYGNLECQTCKVDGTDCDTVTVLQWSKGRPLGGGLQEPSRDLGPGGGLQEPSKDSGKLLQKDGMVFNLPTENKTAPSEQNSSTSNNTIAKDLGGIKIPEKLEFPNLKSGEQPTTSDDESDQPTTSDDESDQPTTSDDESDQPTTPDDESDQEADD